MRSLLITATVVTAAIGLAGCPYHKREPIPGPQSAVTLSVPASAPRPSAAPPRGGKEQRPPAQINWFQGTLDEAFSRRPCVEDHPQFRC